MQVQKVASQDILLAHVLRSAGKFLSARGSYSEAELMLRTALQTYEKLPADKHTLSGMAMRDLAILMAKQQRSDEAGVFFEQSVAMFGSGLAVLEKNLGREHPETASFELVLAYTFWLMGRPNEAMILADSAGKVLRKAHHPSARDAGQLEMDAASDLDRLMERAQELASSGRTTEAALLRSDHLKCASRDEVLSKISGHLKS